MTVFPEYVEVDEYPVAPPSPMKLNQTSLIAAGVRGALRIGSSQLWAGEIGPHNGGSVPCDHTQMRWANFGDSFWYVDAMGAHAANGYSAFCRQDFVGIDYGMVDCATYDPLPDYYSGRQLGRGAARLDLLEGYRSCSACPLFCP